MIAYADRDCVYLACIGYPGFYDGVASGKFFSENAMLWEVPNDDGIIAGVAKSPLIADLLRYDTHLCDGSLTYRKMCTEVIPHLRKKLCRIDERMGEDGMRDRMFFASGNSCFYVSPAFLCNEVHGYETTVPSDDYVVAYCEAHPELPPEERIYRGYLHAKRYEMMAGNTVILLNTRDRKPKSLPCRI